MPSKTSSKFEDFALEKNIYLIRVDNESKKLSGAHVGSHP